MNVKNFFKKYGANIITAILFTIVPIIFYCLGFAQKHIQITIILCIFTIVGFLSLFNLIYLFVESIKIKTVEKTGKIYSATVIKYRRSLIDTGPEIKFIIKYKWADENGKEHFGKSTSIFTKEQAEALKAVKYISIKANGKNSIVENSSIKKNIKKGKEILIEERKELRKKVMELRNLKPCQYCNFPFDKNINKCPNCGANRKK